MKAKRAAKKPTKPLRPDDARLRDRLLEDVLHNSRDLFDGLSDHERTSALALLEEYLAAQTPEDREEVVKTIWEVDYICRPIPARKFMTDDDYFGKSAGNLREPWLEALEVICAPGSSICEVILGGCLGGGKTSFGMALTGYKLYELLCLRNPQKYYGLLDGSLISFGIYSTTMRQAADAAFPKLKGYIDQSAYFKTNCPRDMSIESKIRFPSHNLQVITGSRGGHSIGMDLYSFALDEANFFNTKIDKATNKMGGQAYELYNGTMNRLMSRFARSGGSVPGMALLMSSKSTTTSFTENRLRELTGLKDVEDVRGAITPKGMPKPTAYYACFASWDIFPERYVQPSKKTFRVEVGDAANRSRVLADDQKPREESKIVVVPAHSMLYQRFTTDPDQALREFAGVGTNSISPFIRDPKHALNAVSQEYRNPFPLASMPICTGNDTDLCDAFDLNAACVIEDGRWRPRMVPDRPRFIHLDMSITEDATGLSMGYYDGNRTVTRMNPDGTKVVSARPIIRYDFVLRIHAEPNSEVDFDRISSFITFLSQFYPIQRFTTDMVARFMCQRLNAQGIPSALLSVDRTTAPYFAWRAAMREGRLIVPYTEYDEKLKRYTHAHFHREATNLVYDQHAKKVDHPDFNPDGTSGCFAGDTKVSLLDGTEVSLRELAEKRANDTIYVYTIRDGAVSVGEAVKPRLTKRRAKTVWVELDNGERVQCTPDHRFMLRDGTYREASKLLPGDSLMPLYRKESTKRNYHRMGGYELYMDVSNNRRGWKYTHRMVGKWKYGSAYTGNQHGGTLIHHMRHKRNNDPQWLSLETRESHTKLHAEDIKRRRSDPAFEKKRRDAAVVYARSTEGREFSRRNMLSLHQRPGFIEAITERTRELGRRFGRANMTRYNKSEAHRKVASRIGKITGPVNVHLARAGYRAWLAAGNRPVQTRTDVTFDRILHLLRAGSERKWDVSVELKCEEKVVDRVLRENGFTWSQLRDREGVERVRPRPVADALALREQKTRDNLQRFVDRLFTPKNHKVVSVTPGCRADVYDLSVPGTENFALSAGIFVHNSKDVCDGSCGVHESIILFLEKTRGGGEHKEATEGQANRKAVEQDEWSALSKNLPITVTTNA